MKRVIKFLLILFLLILIIYCILQPKNYEKKYNQNEFKIQENYDKKSKIYSFEIKKEELTWNFIVEHSYVQKKKLINEIEILEEGDTFCIIPKSKYLKTYPQCLEENKLIDYRLVNEEMKEKIDPIYFENKENLNDNYEKIHIQFLNDKTFYIWNYKGFYRINKKTKENIKLFDKDIYNINHIFQINNYLVIPDYKEPYYFNQFYLMNLKDGKVKNWNLKESIYFDGYYLGSNKNSIFYVDKKTKTEWEIFPKKKKIRKIGTEKKDGKILIHDEWEKISLNKLVNGIYKFEKNEIYHYNIEDGLYVSYEDYHVKKKISNQNVKEIVKKEKDEVYYLADDSLYYYSQSTGEVLLMSYFEWNFNYNNMIFIY